MGNEQTSKSRTACPHCGKPSGLRWWYLLPSGNSRRVFTCVSCGGKYDLSDVSKTVAIMGALLGCGPAIYVVGKIARHGHGQGLWVLLGTAAAGVVFIVVTVLIGSFAVRLVAKS